jgi:nicotinamidase-related amidase
LSPLKLDPERATLVVIDVQEAFRKAVPTFDDVSMATAKLVRGAKSIGIPIVVTEQYPKGLGSTVPAVAEHLPGDVEPLAKVRFSAAEADGFGLGGRDQVLISTSSPMKSRSTSPPTPSARASSRTRSSAWRGWSAPGRS